MENEDNKVGSKSGLLEGLDLSSRRILSQFNRGVIF
jgi:hypothetical protein